MSEYEKSAKNRVMQARKEGVDVQGIYENHVAKAVGVFSKILLPFVLLLVLIVVLAVPSFLFEVIIRHCF